MLDLRSNSAKAPAFIPTRGRGERAPMREHQGRNKKHSAVSWLEDLAHFAKAIMLCDSCAIKYPADKFGYRRKRPSFETNYVAGRCDGCKDLQHCGLYLPRTGDHR